MKALRVELMKTRHRFIWLIPLATCLMNLAVLIVQKKYIDTPQELSCGYYRFIFTLSAYNMLLLPTVLAAIASRICDTENKGNTYKLLCTMEKKGMIFDCKLILGGLYVLFITLLELFVILSAGTLIGITQPFPAATAAIFLSVTFGVSITVYLLQQVLSLLMDSQLIPLFVGILGSCTGVFSMFFPIDSIARFLPWGYYIIGLTVSQNYDPVTKNSNFYPEPFAWFLFVLYSLFAIALYLAGKRLFLKKEV